VVIIDTPPAASTRMPRSLPCVLAVRLIVAHKHVTLLKELAGLNYNLKNVGIQVVGQWSSPEF